VNTLRSVPLNLRAGELVEIRSEREILATLDAEGRLDGLPFMPEMLEHCGKRFRVFKSAHKTCDTAGRTGGRRMDRAVHLENLRCGGEAHGGCQAACLMFWKEAWLRRVDQPAPAAPEALADGPCTRAGLERATRRADAAPGEEVFACHATELVRATSPLAWWDVRQYVRDLASRNVGIVEFLRIVAIAAFNALQRRRGGETHPPHPYGTLTKTPVLTLDLQPGERVRVRRVDEIVGTLDANSKNRGLWFDVEMTPYCGGTFTVDKRVQKIVNERSGKMMTLPGDCIVLDGVVCRGHFSPRRLFCPRAITSYWREIWLERVEPSKKASGPLAP
jgi:hypothetical protein